MRTSDGRLGLWMASIAVAGTVALVACGSSGPERVLDAQAQAGRRAASEAGCFSCHGPGGAGGVGPSWFGLYGTQVDLSSGGTVIADDAYLRESIVDPGARKVRGFTASMPRSKLSDQEVADIVAYIRAVGPEGTTTTGG